LNCHSRYRLKLRMFQLESIARKRIEPLRMERPLSGAPALHCLRSRPPPPPWGSPLPRRKTAATLRCVCSPAHHSQPPVLTIPPVASASAGQPWLMTPHGTFRLCKGLPQKKEHFHQTISDSKEILNYTGETVRCAFTTSAST